MKVYLFAEVVKPCSQGMKLVPELQLVQRFRMRGLYSLPICLHVAIRTNFSFLL